QYSVDTSYHTLLVSHDRDSTPTHANHYSPSLEQANDRLLLRDVQRRGRGNYSSIASSTVTDDMPSFRFLQALGFLFSVEWSYGLCWILEGRIFRVDEGLGDYCRNRDVLSR